MATVERQHSWIGVGMRRKSRTATPAQVDEAAIRRTLRDQIARLDGELADLGRPYGAVTSSGRGPRLLSIAELERTRDALAAAASDERRRLDELGREQEGMRRVREALLEDPARYRFARVTNAEVGEAGCRDWHVRPRFGLLGMLAGWWRVVISSGCPLPRAARAVAARVADRGGSPAQPRYIRRVNVGDTAPDFELEDQDGQPVKLSDLKGSPVVLYFYPKADTPGCTTQACGIRDRTGEYEQFGAKVLGVSPDKPGKLRKFADKYALPFTLLADTEHEVADDYGAWVEKSMYGRKYWGNARTTFVIDADGKIAHVIPKASPKTHDDEVLKLLAELRTGA